MKDTGRKSAKIRKSLQTYSMGAPLLHLAKQSELICVCGRWRDKWVGWRGTAWQKLLDAQLSFPICSRRQQPRRRRLHRRLKDVGRGGGRHGRRVVVVHRDRQSLLRRRSRRRRDPAGRGRNQCPALGLGFKMPSKFDPWGTE